MKFVTKFAHFSIGTSNNQPSQNPLSMQFCSNGRLNENSFKISLKSPNTLKQPPVAQSQTPTPVTSTNPKTPSPSTNDVRSMKAMHLRDAQKNFLFDLKITFAFIYRMQRITMIQLTKRVQITSTI